MSPRKFTTLSGFGCGDLIVRHSFTIAADVYGIVTAAGDREIWVTWQDGRRQHLKRERCYNIYLVPESREPEAREALAKGRS